MDVTRAAELLALMERHLQFYRDFLAMQQEKLEDMAQDRLEALSGHVKQEEVFYLRSKGIEQERSRFLETEGLGDKTLREIIPTLPEPYLQQVQQVFDDLSVVILDLKQVNQRCSSIAQLRLHRIDSAIKQLEKTPELQKVYQENAQSVEKRRDFLSQKV